MTPEERNQMNQLCTLIQHEKDPKKFGRLVEELNQFLERVLHGKERPSAHS